MLKLNYTESGLHLERIATPLESWVQERALLALRLGECLHLEPSRASFLLPADAPGLDRLEHILRRQLGSQIVISAVDAEYVEVSLAGTWLAASADAEEGTFMTALSDEAEFFLERLWQMTQSRVSHLA